MKSVAILTYFISSHAIFCSQCQLSKPFPSFPARKFVSYQKAFEAAFNKFKVASKNPGKFLFGFFNMTIRHHSFLLSFQSTILLRDVGLHTASFFYKNEEENVHFLNASTSQN